MLMLKKQNVLEAIREIHEQCKTEAEELRVWEVYRAIDEMMPDSGIVPQVVKQRYNRYSNIYYCGNCRAKLDVTIDKFCRCCGTPINWNWTRETQQPEEIQEGTENEE